MKRLGHKGFFDIKIHQRGLAGQFLLPPFSVLHTYTGEWKRRKQQWLALGIKGEVGRGGEVYNAREWVRGKIPDEKGLCVNLTAGGRSVFDPVLCELMYSWFCPKGGSILDPFAGGSVRGVVASCMGYEYYGCELRPEQVQANREQAIEIFGGEEIGVNYPKWVVGDSNKVLDGLIEKGVKYDFIFTCPPYGNLEVYNDLEGDISNIQNYDEFLEAYSSIIHKACHCLRQNRFACFVVANYRDKKGFYHDFVGDTIRAFEECGVHFYNELILVTPPGSLPVRAGRVFSSTRKVGKMHQNVLVFYKGEVKKIKEVFK